MEEASLGEIPKAEEEKGDAPQEGEGDAPQEGEGDAPQEEKGDAPQEEEGDASQGETGRSLEELFAAMDRVVAQNKMMIGDIQLLNAQTEPMFERHEAMKAQALLDFESTS